MVRVEIPEEDKRPEVIREALAGRIPRIPESLAFALVPDLDVPESEQRDIVREALENPALEPPVRVQAARALAELETDTAVSELSRVLETPEVEEPVAATAAAVLGRIGGPDNLAQLQRAKESATSEFLRQRAEFAEAMIVHRFGLTDHEVELPAAESQPAPQAVGSLPFVSRKPGQERRRRTLEGVRQEFPWMEPDQHDVYEIQCGPRLMEVIINRDIMRSEGIRTATQRPALPAVVAHRNEETDDFYPALVALSDPKGQERVSLRLTRLEGETVYMGEGSVGAEGAEFNLRSAKTPGIPRAAFRIRVTREGIEIAGTSDVRAAVPAESPERFELP